MFKKIFFCLFISLFVCFCLISFKNQKGKDAIRTVTMLFLCVLCLFAASEGSFYISFNKYLLTETIMHFNNLYF